MRAGRVNLKILLLGLAVVVPLVIVLANGFRYDPKEIASPLVGKPAPDFQLTALDGAQTVQLSALKGTPVVVNFWATWCVPCQAEHGTLLQLARAFEGKVAFLGVVYQDEPGNIQKWLDKRGSFYPQLIDTGSKAALAYGVYGVPETYVIDRSGTIVDKVVGPVSGPAMTASLTTLLGGR